MSKIETNTHAPGSRAAQHAELLRQAAAAEGEYESLLAENRAERARSMETHRSDARAGNESATAIAVRGARADRLRLDSIRLKLEAAALAKGLT